MAEASGKRSSDSSQTDPEATRIGQPFDSASTLVQVLDAYMADLQAGKSPNKAAILAEHPDLAGELENCLSGIDFVHNAGRAASGTPAQLGDFRIIREVGHGGMGVVYEAEQLTLKRRVALKVLRFGVKADPEVMQRFQREAETVAHLHHTNIVPIHAIGCEQGVQYYAMQFIEGKSLSEVQDQHEPDQKIDFRQVAEWMLQAAEALAYAHQRGVIHRDIKPSNLILDTKGTVWLTDFGLAKRADEVTLTAAGILLGTPRYMSPEQAAAASQPVDHRTDIYSLGATLYELATGRPVFDSRTPQGVITQILNAQPVAPRLIEKKLPRDLETIILKCLAKEPARRYQRAQELADDLRAFIDGRSIRARRASLLERVVRWSKQHRRSTTVAAVTAVASLVLIVGGTAGYSAYRESLNGRLSLTTEGPSLVAEILNERDEVVVPAFPVPNPEPIVLLAGTYQLRLSGSEQISETWQLDIERGQLHAHPVRLIDRLLSPAIALPGTDEPEFVELNGKQFILHRGDRGWRLTRGDGSGPAWANDLGKFPEKPEDADHPNSYIRGAWHDVLQVDNYSSYANETGRAPGVVRPATDIDGDGFDDLILASRVSPSLITVSGNEGKVLSWYRGSPNLPQDHDASADPVLLKDSAEEAGVIRDPILVDLDGEPVVIMVVVSSSSSLRTQSGKHFTSGRQFYIEAVRVKSGIRLWRTSIDLPEHATTYLPDVIKTFPSRPQVVPIRGKQSVVLRLNKKLFGFDLASGKSLWPAIEPELPPVQFPQLADLDGDGDAEAVFLLQTNPDRTYSSTDEELTVQAVSLRTQKPLWKRTFQHPTYWQSFHNGGIVVSSTDLIWTADIDGDGSAEIICPVKDDWQKYARHWFGVEILNGATGEPRWQTQLCRLGEFSSSGSGVSLRFALGEDMDGDGSREFFLAALGRTTRITEPENLLRVDALSGANGRMLWTRQLKVTDDSFAKPGRLQWGSVGKDSWKQLIVPCTKGAGGQPITFLLSAASGHVENVISEVDKPEVRDLNSDGLPDIHFITGTEGNRRLTVIQGSPPAEWRRPGHWQPARDFDGDGKRDFLASVWQSFLVAHAGSDGRALWRAECRPMHPVISQLLYIDLNGDQIQDIVFLERSQQNSGSQITLAAISGKDGQRLWTAPDFGLQTGSTSSSGMGPQGEYNYPMLDQKDLDGDGRPEILLGATIEDSNIISLAAMSCDDGRLKWRIPIGLGAYVEPTPLEQHVWGDLDGDSVLDIVLWVPPSKSDGSAGISPEARAYSGRDGSLIWKGKSYRGLGWTLWPRTVIADLDADSKPEVLVTSRNADGQLKFELAVLDGRTGEQKWTRAWDSADSNIWPPLPINTKGDGQFSICLASSDGPQVRGIILLSNTGEIQQRIPLEWIPHPTTWLAQDVNADGKEELLYVKDGHLRALQIEDLRELWKTPVYMNAFVTREIRQQQHGGPATLVGGYYRWLNGIDALSGAIRWRCEIPSYGNYQVKSDIVYSETPERPTVVSHDAQSLTTLVQPVWPTGDDGTYESPKPAIKAFAQYQPPLRYLPLPWARSIGSVNPLRGPGGPHVKTALAFSEWPMVLVAFGAVVFWTSRQQWRKLLIYAAIYAIILTMTAFSGLAVFSSRMEPDERFSWDGWYWIFWITAIPLGAIILAVAVVVSLWKLVRKSRVVNVRA